MKNSHVVLSEFSSSLEEKVLSKESKALFDICLKIIDNGNPDLTSEVTHYLIDVRPQVQFENLKCLPGNFR
jgi:hypothetical protein